MVFSKASESWTKSTPEGEHSEQVTQLLEGDVGEENTQM